MAEYVKQRLENITPELEELKRLNLYNDEEIRLVNRNINLFSQ